MTFTLILDSTKEWRIVCFKYKIIRVRASYGSFICNDKMFQYCHNLYIDFLCNDCYPLFDSRRNQRKPSKIDSMVADQRVPKFRNIYLVQCPNPKDLESDKKLYIFVNRNTSMRGYVVNINMKRHCDCKLLTSNIQIKVFPIMIIEWSS